MKCAARQAKSRATQYVIASVLKLNAHKTIFSFTRLIKQASVCGYFWKDEKIIHATLESLNNQNLMLKIASESSTKRERITDDKNSFVVTKFVSIVGTSTSSISNHKNILTFLGLLNIDYLITVM